MKRRIRGRNLLAGQRNVSKAVGPREKGLFLDAKATEHRGGETRLVLLLNLSLLAHVHLVHVPGLEFRV
jgi:hypothetical protein